MLHPFVPITLLVALLSTPVCAQNCNGTSTGRTPLTDLGSGTYQGFAGGLYPGGSNTPPAAHAAAGQLQAQAVQPLNPQGQPDPAGRIVLVSIGMSNTTQEFSTWVPVSNADPQRNARVTVVDCAQGGQDAVAIANPQANFWTVCGQRLTAAGVTPQQVQAVWLKEAIAGPQTYGGFPAASVQLQQLLVAIAHNLKTFFPNARLCYLSSRIYAGYATSSLNPEPYAYESGFAVKWLIEQQLNGDATLNFDPSRGPVLAPWLCWGPYLWADGVLPRSDGLSYVCSDFQADGTHPNTGARAKVTALLDTHFRTAPTSTPWYLGNGGNTQAAVFPYGTGCADGDGPVNLRTNGVPSLGNAAFRLGVSEARAGVPAVLFLGLARAAIALDPACTLLVDPTQLVATLPFVTGAAGTVILNLPIPGDPALLGGRVDAQWLLLDSQAPGLPIIGGAAMTAAAELRLGTP